MDVFSFQSIIGI